MDARARGVFFGLALRHERKHLIRAVMEGVAFALRDSLEIFRSLGVSARQVLAAGGGARSPVWQQVQADVFGTPLAPAEAAEPAACGAAILAGVGTGVFPSLEAAAERITRTGKVVEPIPANVARYNELYPFFRSLYPRLKAAYGELSRS